MRNQLHFASFPERKKKACVARACRNQLLPAPKNPKVSSQTADMVFVRDKHRVQPGDTFFAIAARYSLSHDDLLDANKERNVDLTAPPPGMILAIPSQQKPRSEYTVRAGDTLWRIALLTGNPPSVLLEENPGAGRLVPGLRLKLQTCQSVHVLVKDGKQASAPWSEDERFQQVLSTQIYLLQPRGSAVFKYPAVERPKVECFVTVQ